MSTLPLDVPIEVLDDDDHLEVGTIVETCITEYGAYTHQTKFPSFIDGLKASQRRILETLYAKGPGFHKVASIAAGTMAIHPHGDGSIEAALVRMGQPWHHALTLVELKGSTGSYSGESAADGRYLDVTLAEFARDVFYSINRQVLQFTTTYDGKTEEPLYLVPKVPMALLTGAFGIGIAFSTNLPQLNFNQLCELTKEYIRRRQSVRGASTLAPDLNVWFVMEMLNSVNASNMVPDFASPCNIRNMSDVITAYTAGEFDHPVVIDGVMDVFPDSIVVRALPPGQPFGKLCNGVANQIGVKDTFATSAFTRGYSRSDERNVAANGKITFDTRKGEFVFHLRKGVEAFAVIDQLKRALRFTANWRPQILGLDADNVVRECNLLQVIEMWFIARHKTIMSDLFHQQNDLVREIERLRALQIVREYPDRVIGIIRSAADSQAATTELCRTFNLTQTQASFLTALTIGQLNRKSQSDLVGALALALQKLQDMRTKFTSVGEQMIAEIEHLQSKYSSSAVSVTRSWTIHYHGYLRIGSGFIQFRDDHEMLAMLSAWEAHGPEIVFYPTGSSYRCAIIEGKPVQNRPVELPREFVGEAVYASKLKPNWTVFIREGKVFRVAGLVHRIEGTDDICCPIGNSCTMIDRDGTVRIVAATDIPLRKAASAQGNLSAATHVSPLADDDLIIVHANPSVKNKVRMERVANGSKLTNPAVGTLLVCAVVRVRDRFVVNVPAKVQNRTNIAHILVDRPADVLPNIGDVCVIELTKQKTNTGRKLIKMPGSSLYKIE